MTAPALVADIGGTNARFAIAHAVTASGPYELAHARKFKASEFAHLDDAVRAFLDDAPGEAPRRACVAVAAPISDGDQIRFTNSPWTLSPKSLAAAAGVSRLETVNDFMALARGAVDAGPAECVEILPGAGVADAPVLVVGPGTGLGMSVVLRDAGGVRVLGTEGGHLAFSPRSELEIEVYRQLHREAGYVPFELLLSGRGLMNIHRLLCTLSDAPYYDFSPAEISSAALRDDSAYPTAKLAVDVFCGVLGTYVGNGVVVSGGRGGVILGGGILPRIVDLIPSSDFAKRFRDLGPMSGYVTDVPVRLITSDDVALRGAAALLDDGERP